MKFLVTWTWKGKDGEEINKRFAEWKPVEGTNFLFPMHTLVGANKAFTITEGNDIENMVKNIQPWTDVCCHHYDGDILFLRARALTPKRINELKDVLKQLYPEEHEELERILKY